MHNLPCLSLTVLLPVAWLRGKCLKLGHLFVMPSPDEVVKLSGDNSSEEKERVMCGFLEGLVMDLADTQCGYNCLECRVFRVLISTDCAGMGIHVPGLRLVLNCGEF